MDLAGVSRIMWRSTGYTAWLRALFVSSMAASNGIAPVMEQAMLLSNMTAGKEDSVHHMKAAGLQHPIRKCFVSVQVACCKKLTPH